MDNLKLWVLDNPSDPYTFYAPNVEIAGIVACSLSSGFGAHQADKPHERTPILFGWEEWFEEKGIIDLQAYLKEHAGTIADAFDSFLIGDVNKRKDVEHMLELLPEDKKQEWRDSRQDRMRSSINQIGESAYLYAQRFRAHAQQAYSQ
ncbi:hypothetical protein [Vibrio navarrensis]|uniref:hypothetical protein n=1 Tax=Vibrio navarrensis TaxID=29495 RepID=UPI0015585D88|nr:hypothetical protein [Vibrio navarrensis]